MKERSILFLVLVAVFSGSISLVNGFQQCLSHINADKNQIFALNSLQIHQIGDVGLPLKKTTNGLAVEISGEATGALFNPQVRVTLNVLGIDVDSKVVEVCGERRCSMRKGDKIELSVEFEVHRDFPVAVPGNIIVEVQESCFTQKFIKHEDIHPENRNNQHLFSSSRFGFSKQEVDFLFEKWVKHYGSNIFLPGAGIADHLQLHQASQLEERKNIFRENLIKIAAHNSNPESSFKMAMNHFGHLTAAEFKPIFASGMRENTQNNLRNSLVKKPKSRSILERFIFSTVEDSVDRLSFEHGSKLSLDLGEVSEVNWVERGAVTEVKNQGACGSCWSFATTGALEGAYFIKTGKLEEFSEQQLVSCDHVDLGCNGGAFDNAFAFAESQGGLCREADFPYTASQGVRGFCEVKCTPVSGSAPTSVVDLTNQNEQELLAAVAKQPVAVAIEADEAAFQFYSSGVLTAPCAQRLDHGVLAVGFGTDADSGTEFWLVKNSWGPMWGLNGYIKLERGIELEEGGECGILLGPSYPVL